jgi:hypothetical protein
MTPRRWLAVGFVLAAAAIAGVVYSTTTRENLGADSSTGGAPVQGQDPEAVNDALQMASDRVGFAPKVPNYFPTSADQLVWVDSSTGPAEFDSGFRIIELVYQSDEPFTVADGADIPSLVEIFLKDGRLLKPNGELAATGLAGYDVYLLVVDQDDQGNPLVTTYTALAETETIILNFSGEQPTLDGVAKMLESFAVVEPR